jgi:mannose-1-phosphate guanylyltransferase/mannose-6-phosphate isomerase
MLEPFGRNTAPAAALAAMHIAQSQPDALMLVLPADHHIPDVEAFHAALAQASVLAREGHLVLFGIVPTAAETGFGYVRQGASLGSSGHKVERFVEKPDQATAQTYIDNGGYLWNSGMFLMGAATYLDELQRHAPDIYDTCRLALQHSRDDVDFMRLHVDTFALCPDDSIDYAVMEKTSKAAIVSLDAGWSDLGAWSALFDVHKKDADDNVLLGDVVHHGSRNCFVRAENRLVSLVGVEDLVVVDTSDAVMVAHVSAVQDVKKIVAKLQGEKRSEVKNHREVFRPWGSYDSISMGDRFQVKRIKVKPGASLSLQKHHHRAEHWIVVSGTALVTCGENEFLLTENESTYISVGQVHRLVNPGRIMLEIVEIQTGAYLGEDDIVRLQDNYGRTAEAKAGESQST